MKTISVDELHRLNATDSNVKLLDVRSPGEFRAQHVPFAHNLPLDRITSDRLSGIAKKDEPVYLICLTGGRSAKAASILESYGFLQTFSVEGGTKAWKAADFPTTDGKQSISIERQVRIVAGSLVLLGSVLAYFAHPAFIVIPAFIGSGLAFAGITDTCGMGMALMKMPWNR